MILVWANYIYGLKQIYVNCVYTIYNDKEKGHFLKTVCIYTII